MTRRRTQTVIAWIGSAVANWLLLSFCCYFGSIVAMSFCKQRLGWDSERAYAAALLAVFMITFWVYRYFTYASIRVSAERQFLLYVAATGLFWLMEFYGFVWAAPRFDLDYKLTVLILTLASMLIKSLVLKYVVFAKR